MIRTLLILMMAALVLGACGKKGDLRPPPGYEQPQNTQAEG